MEGDEGGGVPLTSREWMNKIARVGETWTSKSFYKLLSPIRTRETLQSELYVYTKCVRLEPSRRDF